MPHLHTQPGGHDVTASAYVFRQIEGEWQVLLLKHRKHCLWMQPGGHVEHIENPWQALCHELAEETGYEIEQLDVMQALPRMADSEHDVMHPVPAFLNTHSPAAEHFHSDLSFVLVAEGDPAHGVAEGESTQIGWYSLAQIATLDGVLPDVAGFVRQAVEHVLPTWHRIPAKEFTR